MKSSGTWMFSCRMSGKHVKQQVLKIWKRRLENSRNWVPLVVVKLGRQGALAQRGAERFTSPSKEVVPVDTVGAGDSFDAGFLHEYVRRSRLGTCLASGNHAGALSTTRPGGTEAFRDSDHRDKFIANIVSRHGA